MEMNNKSDQKVEADCSTSKIKMDKVVVKNFRDKYQKNRKMRRRDSHVQRQSFSHDENCIKDHLPSPINGSTADLQEIKQEEKKFSNRSRLFIINLPLKTTEEELNNLFKPFGETHDLFINDSKNFAFIKLDYRVNAERAKTELKGYNLRGRELIIKFAHINGILVKNLPPFVSNELLYVAFSIFGEIERCYILLSEHNKSKGEGIVEYVKKASATSAIKRCTEGCFFITSSLKPVIVENYELPEDYDGYPEATICKTSDYYHERELPPRFAKPGTFEYNYATRWKELDVKYKEKLNELNRQHLFEQEKLEAEMRRAQYDQETERLKEMLRQRELERERYKQEWDMRQQELCNDRKVDTSLRVRQDALFVQANQLSSMLDREERQLLEQWNEEMNRFSSPDTVYSIPTVAKDLPRWRRDSEKNDISCKKMKRSRHF